MGATEITWRGMSPVTPESVLTAMAHATRLGHASCVWLDVDVTDRPVVLVRIDTATGHTLALYASDPDPDPEDN